MAKGTVNKVILIGRLGINPEVRQTQSGTTVAILSLATNEVVKGETQTQWHRVVIFGKAAETIQQYCKKGDALYVEGRIRTNKWQDSYGENRYSTEVIVSNFQLLGGNQDNIPSSDYDSYSQQESFNKKSISANDQSEKGSKDNVPDFAEINSSDFDDIPF